MLPGNHVNNGGKTVKFVHMCTLMQLYLISSLTVVGLLHLTVCLQGTVTDWKVWACNTNRKRQNIWQCVLSSQGNFWGLFQSDSVKILENYLLMSWYQDEFIFSLQYFFPWDIVPFQKVSSVTSDLTLKRLIRFCHWTLRICQGAGGSWHRRKASWQTVLLTNTQTKPEVIWSKSQVKSIFKANHVRSQIAVRLKEKVKSQVIQSSKQWLKSKVTQVTQVCVCFIHCVS